jgi:diacylglycerol kinase family enzyme
MRRAAVLLNRNAQKVSAALCERFRAQLPPDDVYVTTTLEEGKRAMAAIAERRYDAVCVGGGDGTFMQAMRDLFALEVERMPAFIPLRLGTGNAIADVCGASDPTWSGLMVDVARATSDDPTEALPLLDVDGCVTHFSGVGLDAEYAEDHRTLIKERLAVGPLGSVFRGQLGFFLAAVGRTIPRLVVEKPRRVRIVNLKDGAIRLGPGGEPRGDPIPAGDVLYDGPAIIAAASTIVYYSSGIRFFPYADGAKDRFQLRVSSAGLAEILPNLRGIFAGTYQSEKTIFDFLARAVHFELEAPTPFHVGGDVQPRTTGFSIALADRTLPLLRVRRG